MEQDITARLLLQCEQNRLAPAYGGSVSLKSYGREIVILSDLHMSAGKGKDGNYSGTEDFFADAAFLRFLRSLNADNPQPIILVINGDFLDFLRITDLPQTDNEFAEWLLLLQRVGMTTTGQAGIPAIEGAASPLTILHLKNSISDKERKYGLKTDEYKSIWKIARIVKGHPDVFDALAEWLDQGNTLIITKGNHDLEWYWSGVRNYLRLALAERVEIMRQNTSMGIDALLRTLLLPSIHFIDDSLLIDGDCYIEHGHKRDKYTTCIGQPVLEGSQELNIPFGSFFNRYLINRIELIFPYIDNVRPRQNILPVLFRKNFFVGMRVLFQHIPFMLLIIPKKYYHYMFSYFLTFLLAIVLPIIFMLYLIADTITGSFSLSLLPTTGLWSTIAQKGMETLGALLMPPLSYFLTRILSYFKLAEPDYLSDPARELFSRHRNYRFIIMGHTHNPEQFRQDRQWYYNTGTWIPVIEASSEAVRQDRTYTFLHLRHESGGPLQPGALMRWNDDASRCEPLVLFCEK